MNAIEVLRYQFELSKKATADLLADMQDAPLAAPTSKGGNHPVWVAGHLVYSEANLINHILLGDTNPLIEWKELFGGGSEPTSNASDYPSLDTLLAKWDDVRVQTMKVLDSLSDEDLDKPAAEPPPGREAFFGTCGQVLCIAALHPMMHRGQVADSRRAAGREALMG